MWTYYYVDFRHILRLRCVPVLHATFGVFAINVYSTFGLCCQLYHDHGHCTPTQITTTPPTCYNQHQDYRTPRHHPPPPPPYPKRAYDRLFPGFLKRTIESLLNGANTLQADGSDDIIMFYLPAAMVEFVLQHCICADEHSPHAHIRVSHISDPTVDTTNTINSLDLHHDFLPSRTSYTPKVTSTAPRRPPGLLVYSWPLKIKNNENSKTKIGATAQLVKQLHVDVE
ncbi:hypothetical protein DEU56DRAFT_901315 [Suillus clintonianus]|uniref:uncharacterized protein n=1 Tax=Suillus clintonianus TaxID=1904413 RepID=UPI001B886356|nr:uncharacterized protein DEU56DRAFT_901315 [Suillus clintonianus]KAG2138341.1 hypothetical protein DEU56DRAFT_901315 [Suillus clintonianus]